MPFAEQLFVEAGHVGEERIELAFLFGVVARVVRHVDHDLLFVLVLPSALIRGCAIIAEMIATAETTLNMRRHSPIRIARGILRLCALARA